MDGWIKKTIYAFFMIIAPSILIYRGRVVWEDVVGIAPGAREKARSGVKCGRLTVLKEEEAVFEGWEEDDMFYLIEPVVG